MSDASAQSWKIQSSALFKSMVGHYALEREQMHYFQSQLRLMLEMLGTKKGRVLSIGCAAGGEFADLLERACTITGMDYSEEMLRIARQRFAKQDAVSLSRSDAEALPFADASFDIVVCLGVLEYLPGYEKALRESRRVLKPGGVVIYSLPTRISQVYAGFHTADMLFGRTWRFLKRLAGRTVGSPVPEHQRNPCYPWRFQRNLREAGLEPYDSAYNTFFVFPLDRLAPALNLKISAVLQKPLERSPLGWLGAQYIVAARVKETANH